MYYQQSSKTRKAIMKIESENEYNAMPNECIDPNAKTPDNEEFETELVNIKLDKLAQPSEESSPVEIEEPIEIKQLREELVEELKTCAAKDLSELNSSLNSDYAFEIKFKEPNQDPIACKCRRLPYFLREKVYLAIKEQLKAGIIQPSKSPYTAALRIVHKPDSSIHITVDYKPLNKVILIPQYPLPFTNNLYVRLGLKKYFSKVDLKSAFHQIPVHPNSMQYTAFICEFGLFEYRCMPMGISSAPGWFQRFIEGVLRDEIANETLALYMDDLCIGTETLIEHREVMLKVIAKLKNRHIGVSLEKSELVKEQIEYLGKIIKQGEIRPHPKRSQCIQDMPRPVTVVQLQRLLGVANYNREYIPFYAELTRPLYNLMKLKEVPKEYRKLSKGAVDWKKVILDWNEEAQECFYKLRDIMASDLVLALPNFNFPFSVTTDASDYGYGAVLEQVIDDKKHFAFFSKSYTASQRNYSTPEKELLGVVMAIEHWKETLYGSEFTVFTDHQHLTWLLNKKDPHPRLERWMIRLSLYRFTLVYKPGKENIVVDMLSRLPDENTLNNDPNSIKRSIKIVVGLF